MTRSLSLNVTLACFIAFFWLHGMRGFQLDADHHVVALQKVMRRCCDLWGNGLSLYCFIILGTRVQQDKSCWKNGSVLDDLFDELFVVSCHDCLWVGCLWLVVLMGFVMFFVVSFCSGLWGYCFRLMLFHKFRRSIFQQDKSCWTVGVLFWLGYVVSFSDCLWIGCFWLVVMKCLMFAGVDVCMLGVVRSGVQGLEDGQVPF